MTNGLGIVGYLDDEIDHYNYKELLEDYVNLLSIENCNTLEEVLSWILENRAECIIVDHDLSNKYSFNGTDVVSYINKNIPDFPCMILTSHKDDSVQTKLVVIPLIKERAELNSGSAFNDYGQQLKQSCEVFRNRLKNHMEEFRCLYDKKSKQVISLKEEEELKQIYPLLRSYGEIDEIPVELLTSEMSKKMDMILEKLDNISSC